MDLKESVSIVTGGSGVLGGRICHALARAGSNVAATYGKGRESADRLVSEVRLYGGEAEIFHCDVTDDDSVRMMVSEVIDRFGKIDILVNDAAYNEWIPFDDLDGLTNEAWDKIISTNLTGPMYLMRAVAVWMRRQANGRIVNISSVSGLTPSGSSIAYAVSKAALNHLTRCMAVGLAPEILVNCVAPGFLEGTKMTSVLAPEFRERARQGAALLKAADKDDVAAQVVEFCRTDSITGQTIAVDSGRVFH